MLTIEIYTIKIKIVNIIFYNKEKINSMEKFEYKIAICDFEKLTHNQIKSKIKAINSFNRYIIDSYYNSLDILKAKKQYDIIFISMELKEFNGIFLANQLRCNGNSSFIILLSYNNIFVQEAFKVNAFRYLNKPIKASDLTEALDAIDKTVTKYDDSIIINSNNKITRILKNDIIYIESYGDGSYIYNSETYVETKLTLKSLILQLESEAFFQVHKSYIVSFRYIKEIREHEIEMYNTANVIPVSYRRYSQFKKSFLNYTELQNFKFYKENYLFNTIQPKRS